MELMKKASNGCAEDFVEYTIYPTETSLFKTDKNKYLSILRDECLSILSQYTMNYMWHQDPFTLKVKETYLHGLTRISDNIEDEWFIISLLYKLTEIKHDLVIRVVDQDGEVLLIESADQLPRWAQEPEISDSRVYIYQNEMHLIPVAQNPSQLTPLPVGKPNVDDAVKTVQRYPEVTRASPQVQSVIKARMKSYPDDWSDQKQYVHMIVPKKIKCLLSSVPKYLISAAIRCFYLRDMIDIRNCRTMTHFSPKERLVKVEITLSKCLYAMLVKQEFKPDKRSGWKMPSVSEFKDYKAAELGMKLTCGFEMLLSQSRITIPEDVEHTSTRFDEVRYKRFEGTLYSNGYFKNELKGSKKWTTLASQAKEYFMAFLQPLDLQSDDNLSAQLHRVLRRLENKDPDLNNDAIDQNEEFSKEPDDDSWLNIDPLKFDEMLKRHFYLQDKESVIGAQKNKSEEEIPAEIKQFLKTMSDFEGVELSQNEKMESQNVNNNKMKFNVQDFESAMNKMFDVKEDTNYDKVESSSDEYSEDECDLNQDTESKIPEVKSYFEQMKGELQGTNVMSYNDNGDAIESLDELDKPVNVDATVLKNILESYNSQNGLPGPASTLLQPLGIDVCDKL